MPEPNSKTPLLSGKKPPVSRPKNQRKRSSFEASTYNGRASSYIKETSQPTDIDLTSGLDLWQLLMLTVCMAGVQFTWTVELSYGTPYLLSLDLSKEMTALVWLAGPLSGLLVQPLIGAFSDKCTSRLGKRRPFIIVAGLLTCLSMVGIAYAKELAYWSATLTTADPHMIESKAHANAIVIAVASFYFLDFTLNATQAICRALILDIPPLWQQDLANAWSARMSNTAMVIGYFVGYIDLVTYFPWMGNSQVKVFCIIAILVFIITLAITCLTTQEKVNTLVETEGDQPWYSTFFYIWKAFRFLPAPIQTLCNTQFFAWMGWFPFLFYSTQWVSDIYFATHPTLPEARDWAEGTRAGSFALLCYSVTSVLAGLILPALVARFNHWRLFDLLNVYTLSHLTVAVALISTVYVRTVFAATVVLSVMGIPWAIVLWIPFSLVGEFVSAEDLARQKALQTATSSHQEELQHIEEFDAGMILGVHNMYVVFPQFAIAIVSSFIFVFTREDQFVSSVTPVLIFGGIMAFIAAAFSRSILRVVKH
ncbi:major facilitator superfamily domain-containing protein [Sporodiniella umbellata]|nr:major facilitator superfamily domain-containing protein [Sporodiniella umbellata]